MKKAAHNTSIRVFCRLRPLNQLEKDQGGECCVQYTEQAIKVKVAGTETPYDFSFDGIFGAETPQVDLFTRVAKPVIDGLMEGYNGTIFAYGQTSSGKTYTMEGPDIIDSEAKLGIVPRVMNYLFNMIMNSSEDIEFSVKVSFLELYNEKLQDLLDPRKNNLQIKEDKSKGIFVQDITEVYVNSAEQMRQVHKSGAENKTTAATRMNERSSRSHSIFILNLQQKNTKTETTKQSKLYFVDLAGSEKIAKTNVTGQQLEEAKNINKSLTALGMVINALTEKDKGHVPYRDSKLTRLLQESLGGNSQTSLILAMSMCTYNDKETLDTLRFGNRAKSIKNAPIVNAERSAKELTILLNAAEKKIKEQEAMILTLQQGGTLPHISVPKEVVVEEESEDDEVEEAKEHKAKSESPPHKAPASKGAPNALALLKTQLELSKLREEAQELKSSNEDLEAELSSKNKEIYDLNGKILQYENQISEFTSKNVLAIEEYQVQFEKLYHENQEKSMLATKFKRAINRLKSDLNFVYISKHLKVLENESSPGLDVTTSTEKTDAANKDDLIVSSIQKTLEILEEIDKEINESEKKTTSNEDMENLIEAFMKNSPTNSINKENRIGSPGKFRTDLLIADAEEDLKNIPWMTESSGENKDILDVSGNFRLDTENEEDIAQKIQLQFQSLNEDEKLTELQSLVTNQRKTINNLHKLNNELSQTNNKLQNSQEKNIHTYQLKLEEMQKLNGEKVKDYETKLHNLKSSLELKIKELDGVKANYDKYMIEKSKVIAELKQQNNQLQGLIAGNDAAKRNLEIEKALKEVTNERTKITEDLLKLRKETDEKDDIIAQKTHQIELLQNNLGLAAKEIKMLKQYKPANVEINPNSARGQTQGSSKDGKHGQKKTEFALFDKHVVKPIRGGGGDASTFAKNNFFVFDKASVMPLEEKKAPRQPECKTPRGGAFSFNEEPKSLRLKDENSFKKFDDILKQKGGNVPVSKVKAISSGLRVDTDIQEDEEDDIDMNEVKRKLGNLTARNSGNGNVQKQIKSFFGGVKNLFS